VYFWAFAIALKYLIRFLRVYFLLSEFIIFFMKGFVLRIMNELANFKNN